LNVDAGATVERRLGIRDICIDNMDQFHHHLFRSIQSISPAIPVKVVRDIDGNFRLIINPEYSGE